MHLLLTGGTGFIGFNLAKEILNQRNKLTLISRNTLQKSLQIQELIELGANVVKNTEQDYLSRLLNESEKFDAVIHLAAHYTRKHTAAEIRPIMEAAIILGTEMLEIAKFQKCRFLYAGSYLEYMTGNAQVSTLYVESKRVFDRMANYYQKSESVKTTKMIFFDTYGPGDTRDKIINRLISAKLGDRELVIKSPNQLIDLTHITDVVQGIFQTVRNPWVDAVRINSGNFIKISNLQNLVQELPQKSSVFESQIDLLVETFPALAFSRPENWTAKVGLLQGLIGMSKDL